MIFEEIIILVFFSILVCMATNNKSIASGTVYARSPFYQMEKVLIEILNSSVKWRESGHNLFNFRHSVIQISSYGVG